MFAIWPEASQNDWLANTLVTGLATAQDGSEWDSMESDFVSRLEKPIRPTTPVMTTTTQTTTLEQTTRTTVVHDHDEGGADDDDDTQLVLRQTISLTNKPAKRQSVLHSIASEPHLLCQYRHRPISFQVARAGMPGRVISARSESSESQGSG